MSENQFQTSREMLRELTNNVKEINTKTDRMHNIILGDRDAGVDGHVDRLKKVEKYIGADKKMKWIGAGGILAGGTGIGFKDKIINMLSNLF